MSERWSGPGEAPPRKFCLGTVLPIALFCREELPEAFCSPCNSPFVPCEGFLIGLTGWESSVLVGVPPVSLLIASIFRLEMRRGWWWRKGKSVGLRRATESSVEDSSSGVCCREYPFGYSLGRWVSACQDPVRPPASEFL